MDLKVRPGDIVRDKVTGFQGIATGRFEYLAGTTRIQVEVAEVDDGAEIPAPFVFDEDQLTIIEEFMPA